MARRVIGYDGGRPVYEDEGPGRGRVEHQVGEGKSSLLRGAGPMPDREYLEPTGQAPIERRQLSQQERRARADEAIARIPRLHMSPASRETGGSESAERARSALPVATPAVQAQRTPSRELPGVIAVVHRTQPVTPPPSLEEEAMTTAPVRIAPPEDGPKLEVPCADCVKADVCAIRPTLDVAELVGTGVERHQAIHLRVVVECDAFLAAVGLPKPREAAAGAKPPRHAAASPFAVPRPDTAQRSQEPAVLERRSATDKRAEEIAAVVDRHDGDRRAAAAELKMRPQAVGRILTSYLGRVAAREAVPA